MNGTASIRATATGIELRQGQARITIYRHQILSFTDYAVDWLEQLERQEHSG